MNIYASTSSRAKKYHARATCDGLNATWTYGNWPSAVLQVSRIDAIRRGLEPCKTCKPGPLLTVA